MRILLIALLCVPLAVTQAQEPPAPAQIWNGAVAVYKPLKSLRVDMESVTTGLQKLPFKQERKIQFERPDRWRLETTPESVGSTSGRLAVADGNTIFIDSGEGFAKKNGSKYGAALNAELGQSSHPAAFFLDKLLSGMRFETLFQEMDDGAVQPLASVQVDGCSLVGFRVRAALEIDKVPGVMEHTVWFDASDKTLRRVQHRVVHPVFGFTASLRVTTHEMDIALPPQTFASPFPQDVVDPEAASLLQQAALFYGGLQSLSMKVTIRDLNPDKTNGDELRDGTNALFLHRSGKFRLEQENPEGITPHQALFDGENIFFLDGKSYIQERLVKPLLGDLHNKILWGFLHDREAVVMVWKLFEEKNLLEEDRSKLDRFAFYTLRRLPAAAFAGQRLDGVQLRLHEGRPSRLVQEQVLWFDLGNPNQPILKRVQSRFNLNQSSGSPKDWQTLDEITDFQINPDLPETLFHPAPGAVVKDKNDE